MALFKREPEPLRLSGRDTADGQGTYLVNNDETKEPEVWTETEVEQNRRFKEFLALTPPPYITFSLIGINVAVFLVMAASGVDMSKPVPAVFVRWGADYAPFTTHGQWWRLLTAMFLHFGVMHLTANMGWLFVAGNFTERLFGPVRFALLYVLAGIGGGIASNYWTVSVSAGASGAVFGVYGGLLGFLLLQSNLVPMHRIRSLGKGALIFVVFNLIYSLTAPEINIAAHVGGLLTGLLLGSALTRSRLRWDSAVRLRMAIADVAVALAILVGLILRLPAWDNLQAELQRLDAIERATPAFANPFTTLPRIASDRTAAWRTITELLPQWDSERQRISALRVPYQQRGMAEKMAKYVSFRYYAMALWAQELQQPDSSTLQAAQWNQQAANKILTSLASAAASPQQKRKDEAVRQQQTQDAIDRLTKDKAIPGQPR